MKSIFKTLLLLIALSAVPVFAQSDFEATKARAEAGDAEAQAELGYMYGSGTGITPNIQQALRWFRLAAEQGNADAQYELGVMYADGKGVSTNDQEAVKWFRLAAEQGIADAQTNLGLMYSNGSGVARNDQEAVRWYRLAATHGDPYAQFMLAMMYVKGTEIVVKDDREAVTWLRLAALQGLDLAQLALGVMYESGSGIGQDFLEARQWYGLATQQGNTEAKARYASIDTLIQTKAQELAAQNSAYNTQCVSFGFGRNTPEMANCMLELHKIANQPQQTTQTILDSARSNTADPAAAIELFNISRDILNNTGTRAAPAPTSVRCTRFGDFSGQVYTFNMACPMGYVQSF